METVEITLEVTSLNQVYRLPDETEEIKTRIVVIDKYPHTNQKAGNQLWLKIF